MKIDAMLKREDFYFINESSLENYFFNVYKLHVNIKTRQNVLFDDILIYPKINAIIHKNASKAVLTYISTEFSIRGNIYKNIAAKLYVFLCFFSKGILASKTLQISKNDILTKNTLIWPCNRKIRIFDFKTKTVDTIVKEGFTLKFFYKEISFRTNNSYFFIPQLLEKGTNWYKEEILSGKPLARVIENSIYNKCIDDVITYLKIINKKSTKKVVTSDYCLELYQQITILIENVKTKKHINTTDIYQRVALKLYLKASKFPNIIPLTISHGDLQSGNIWYDNNKNQTYILDWETNGYRSVWYDPATLLQSTRRNNGILNLFNNSCNQDVIDSILITDDNKMYNPDLLLSVLLLEDIIFYLEDNLELPSHWGGDLIDKYGLQLAMLNL